MYNELQFIFIFLWMRCLYRTLRLCLGDLWGHRLGDGEAGRRAGGPGHGVGQGSSRVGVLTLHPPHPAGVWEGTAKNYLIITQMNLECRPLYELCDCSTSGVLSIPADQQEALCRPLLFVQCSHAREDGLQGHWDRQKRQLPPGGQPNKHMPAEHPHWTVRSNMDIIPIDTPSDVDRFSM